MQRFFFGSFVLALTAATSSTGVHAQQDEHGWLHDVADQYRSWGRVDDELRWAPWLCRMPRPSRARVSRADAATHGRKVYFIYASDRSLYMQITRRRRRRRPSVGFTVVKEAFLPHQLDSSVSRGSRVPLPGASSSPTDDPPGVYTPIPEDGHMLGAGEPAGLYVLRYVGRSAPETDRGWTYGTITADGEVTSDGVIERCVGCHQSAPHGRLFGTGS